MKAKYGRIIIYKIKKELPPGIKSRISQKLLGYKDKSNFGKYTYKREGLLDKIPHLSPIRGVIIVRGKDYKKIFEFLKDKADIFSRRIILTGKDKKKLKV
ncbi:hypothetical protein DRJ04_00955 [Candidatus Aerophobetes bacterium]|uniref:Uncharacterized protein n=2 Tax=Aerophobetes bacterium TaxID=2030807 RepID=A0A662DMP6_UNCAE|nr:MAG: hypothetical protein DRJ04_00955 [Candidatus Aerophobetes bacterium]